MTILVNIDRRLFLGAAAGLALAPMAVVLADDKPKIRVFKSPACGCCGHWAKHLAMSGFDVTAEDVDDLTPIKRMAGVPDRLRACHTAEIEGYTIEGHIPASAIEKLLAERPAIRGLAVPGMPAGSPGMPSDAPERYDVIAFGEDGDQVFMSFIETDEQ